MALVLAAVGFGAATPASAATGPITFDITAPAQGAHYTVGQAVYAQYTCRTSDFFLGSEDCRGPVPSGSAIDTATPGAHTFVVQARYRNIYESDPVTYYVDAVPGSIVLTSPAEGITYDRTKPPLATYSCKAGTAGLKSCVGTDTWTGPVSLKKTPVTNGGRVPATVGKHTFTVVATDNAGATTSVTHSFTIGIGHRPDAILTGRGDNIYDNLTTQSVAFPRRQAPRNIPIVIQNDGLAPERFRLKGDGTPFVSIKPPGAPRIVLPGWSIGYYERGSCSTCLGRNITKWVVAGTYTTPLLSRGGSQTIFLAAAPLPFGVAVNRTVAVSSTIDPGSHDAVRASLR